MSDVPVKGTDAIATPKHSSLLGFLLILLGFMAMGSPMLAGMVFAAVLGLFLVVAGVSRIIHSFQSPTFGRGLLFILWGILGVLCGLAMFARPLLGAVMLTYVVAIYFVFEGIVEIVMALKLRGRIGSGWAMLSGVVNLVLGMMILAHWPLSGLWAIGVLVGINILMSGITILGVNAAAKGAQSSSRAVTA